MTRTAQSSAAQSSTAQSSAAQSSAASPSTARTEVPRTVVIGAGIAGLATAALLARDGHAVTVLERNSWLGGRAGIHRESGFTFDTGPSWYLMPEVFDHFFRLCGTSSAEQLDLVPLDPGYRVFAEDGLTVDVPYGRDRVRELFESLEPGSGERLDTYLDSASDAYDLALRHFLYSTFRSPAALADPAILRRLGPLAGMLTGSLADRIDATVTHPLLRQILGYPAVFLAMYPERAPGIYPLMSRLDLIDGVQYPRGGMHTIIDAIERQARAAGVEIRTGAEVVALPTAPAGRRGTITEVVARTESGLEVFECDHVVAACDLHHLETRLLDPAYRTAGKRTWAHRDPGMGGAILMLGVDRRLDRLAHHNLFFTADWDANFAAVFGEERSLPDPASVYVCAPSRTDPGVAPDGCENLFVLVPCPADPSLRAGQPAFEAYCDRIIEQIARWSGEADFAENLDEHILVRRTLGPGDYVDDFHAWQGTVLGPANTLAQSVFLRGGPRRPAGLRASRLDNLLYAGAFTAPGVGLPMCLISAENVVKELRGDTSGGWLESL